MNLEFKMSVLRIVKSTTIICNCKDLLTFTHFRGRVEKTNKSELWNCLTYRCLIFVRVGRNTKLRYSEETA